MVLRSDGGAADGLSKTALVLSAGGMFGAYQAGAWKALSQVWKPDLVVGTSIGALNGWAIAGGCSPERLIQMWLELDDLAHYRWRFPRSLGHGLVDSKPMERLIEKLHGEFLPRIEYGLVVTDTVRLRPVLYRGPEVTWRHLAASAAIPGFFSQHRIGGRACSDGGLLSALPVWAAAEMGAQRVVAVNVLPTLPNLAIRTFVGAVRKVARFRAHVPASVQVIRIDAPAGLGTAKEALFWNRGNAARWIEKGEADARAIIGTGAGAMGFLGLLRR